MTSVLAKGRLKALSNYPRLTSCCRYTAQKFRWSDTWRASVTRISAITGRTFRAAKNQILVTGLPFQSRCSVRDTSSL